MNFWRIALALLACLCTVSGGAVLGRGNDVVEKERGKIEGATEPTQSPEPGLVKVYLRNATTIIGAIVHEDDEKLTLLDPRTEKQITIARPLALKVERAISDHEAIKELGLGSYIAWKIKRILENERLAGNVVGITPDRVYISIGGRDGIIKGANLRVYRTGEALLDPKTGETLGHQRTFLATLRVVEVMPKFAKCVRTSEVETELRVEDDVELDLPRTRMVAILPLADATGQETPASRMLAERLTTDLVAHGISVVERSLVDKVLAELALHQAALVDPATAQQLGKLTGAFAVLTGTLATRDDTSMEAHVRLIGVRTGQVLLAVSEHRTVRAKGMTARPAKVGKTGTSRTDSVKDAIDKKITVRDSKPKLEILAATYGTEKHSFNVTKELNNLIVDNSLDTIASDNIAGDPQYGVHKTLWIKYRYGQKVRERTFKQGRKVVLP